MAHTHDVYDTGKRFEINGISRFIRETSQTKLVLVQGDHKSEVVTFEMPRYIDGHDMLLCNKIRVHYINIEAKSNNISADIYEVTDLKLCEDCGEDEEETLLFTWTIEAPATKYFGSLSFLVKFECTEGDNILYQWNTARYVNINVLNGIDNSEAFVDKYSNVLEEWYNKLMGESETVANLVETAGQQLEDCEKATMNATKATNSCNDATKSCISATEDAESVRAEVEAGGFIESLKEINNGSKFSTWIGTKAEYEALEEKQVNCLYILTDDKSIQERIDENKAITAFEGTERYYEKLPDGTFKAKVKYPFTGAITAPDGNAYHSEWQQKKFIDVFYPTISASLKSIFDISATIGHTNNMLGVNITGYDRTDNNGMRYIEYYVFSHTPLTIEESVIITFEILGKWK